MKKLINKYQIGGWFPIGYDNNIYRSTYGTMLPEVRVVAKGDPRKVNNDYYKAGESTFIEKLGINLLDAAGTPVILRSIPTLLRCGGQIRKFKYEKIN